MFKCNKSASKIPEVDYTFDPDIIASMPRAEDYQHLPIKQVHLEWQAKANDPKYDGGRLFGQELPLTLDLAVHPNNSGRIIINYPGRRGDINGYNDKHRKLALYMQGEGLGAVVRGKGPDFPNFNGFTFDTQLRKMIDYTLENAEAISGAPLPEILLIGTSAGGGAAAVVARDYEAVARILLMAPGAIVGERTVRESLGQFAGEVFIVIGREDENVLVESGEFFYGCATRAYRRELFIIPDCDHQFRGEVNGRIMSQAPFYAFARSERPNFPDPQAGIVLYV